MNKIKFASMQICSLANIDHINFVTHISIILTINSNIFRIFAMPCFNFLTQMAMNLWTQMNL